MPSFSVLPGCEGFLFSPSTSRWSLNQNPFRLSAELLKDQHMKNALFASLALAGALLVPSIARSQYATGVSAYNQGAGANPSYSNPTVALGAPSQLTPGVFGGPVDPFDPPYLASQIVGLGAGGSLTLHFDNPILNDPSHPYGLDFIIFGHSGFNITNGDYSGGGITDGSFFTGGTSTSRFSVSADGLTFYTLNPSLTPQVDGRFPTDSTGDPLLPVNPGLTQADFAGQGLSGIRALYAGSDGGMGFDLSMAQDGLGNSVFLPVANYVRIDVLSDVAYIDAVSVVPEPGCGAILGLAGGIWALGRRKTSNFKLQTSGKHQH